MKQINYKKSYTKSVLCDTSGWSNVELSHTPTFCSLGSIQIGHKYTDDTHLYTISFGRLNCQTTFPLSNIHLPSTEVFIQAAGWCSCDNCVRLISTVHRVVMNLTLSWTKSYCHVITKSLPILQHVFSMWALPNMKSSFIIVIPTGFTILAHTWLL